LSFPYSLNPSLLDFLYVKFWVVNKEHLENINYFKPYAFIICNIDQK